MTCQQNTSWNLCNFFKDLDLNDVIIFGVYNAMSTMFKFIKLWDDFNLHSCVAQRILRILLVALGRKSLCTTALNYHPYYDIELPL